MIDIKRYCKDADITGIKFIETCCLLYLDGKWKRNDVVRLFVRFSDYSLNEIKDMVYEENYEELYPVVSEIAKYMRSCIINKNLDLKPIQYHEHIDGMSKKKRIIGVQEPLHQMFDYVAVRGMEPMLKAKIGVFQCASLPGRGQSYGKKHIERWIRKDKVIYYVKGDVAQCFPSISIIKLKELLKRDVASDVLLWLVYELLNMFKTGLSIGSFLSQYLCNYYLSYAYHYASEQLFKIRKTKRNGNVRVRLINHVLFYMDDFLLIGSSKKDIRKAMRMLIKYFHDFLLLEIKPDWKICKLSDAEPIDMMGFVFRKDRTTIRTRIFIKNRRFFLRAGKLIRQNKPIPLLLARQCVSAYGWYKNTDSYMVRQKLDIDLIHYKCKKVISNHAKGGGADANIIQPKTT